MQTLEAIRRRLRSAAGLLSVVKTMKVLAAVNIRQYQRAVASLVDYNRAIETGLQVVLRERFLPPGGGPWAIEAPGNPMPEACGVLIWGSDQGLCGPLNRQVASYALARLEALGFSPAQRTVLAIGARVREYWEAEGQEVAARMDPPASEAGIRARVEETTLLLDEWRTSRAITHVYCYHARTLSGGGIEPCGVRLLPLDPEWIEDLLTRPWESRSLPVHLVESERLFSSLVQEHLFAALYRAFAESLASENASRLAAMQRAQHNIEEHLEELTRHYHRARQSAITEELLDIVSGFEVLEGGRGGPGGRPPGVGPGISRIPPDEGARLELGACGGAGGGGVP